MSIESDIKKQAELQRKDIRETGASFREEVRQEAEELRTGIRKGISQTEREAQESIKQIRTLKSEAQRLRDIGTRVDVEPHKKAIKEVQKQSQDIISKAVKSGREITEAEKELIKEIDSNVAEALKEVDKKERGTIKELREKYVELKDGELVDRKEFMRLSAEAQKKLKELGTKGYESYVKKESAKAEKEFKDNNIELDTGEWISKQYYNSLVPADRAELKELGVDKYNEKKEKEAREQFHKQNVALGNGEWVSREFWSDLSAQQRQDLAKLGIEGFNAQQEQQARDFEKNHIQLTTGEWVSKDYWDSLDGYQQADLMFMGVDGFTQSQQAQIQQFEANNVKTNKGEWVNRDFYNNLDEEQKTVLNELGIEGFNEYYKVKRELFENDNRQLETGEWVSKDYWNSLESIEGAQEALDAMGVEGFNEWITDKAESASGQTVSASGQTVALPAQLSSKQEALDLVSTLPDEYKAGEGYDLARYIRDTGYDPAKVQQLITVYGFDNESVKNALTYANQDYYKTGNVEKFVAKLAEQGVDATGLNKDEIQMAAEYIATGDIKIKQDGSIASGALKKKQADEIKKTLAKIDIDSLKTIAKASISDNDKEAGLSVNEFVANYLSVRNIKPDEIDHYKSIAELEYKNLYGEKQYKESKLVSVGEVFLPVFKALQPGKTKDDITGVDWVISGAQLALAVVAPALGAAGKAAGAVGKAALLGSKTVQVASAVAFTGASAAEWEGMSTTQKIVSTVINLAIVGATLKPLIGVRLPKNISSKALTANKAWQGAKAAISELKSTPVASAKYTTVASKAQKAIQASRVADIKFIEELQRVTNISAKQLNKLESVSGIKGIKGAITDVNAARNKLAKVWDELDNYKWGSKEYTQALPKLTEAQANLVKALTTYQSKLKPRINIPKSNKAIDIMDRNVSEAVMAAEKARDTYSAAKSLIKKQPGLLESVQVKKVAASGKIQKTSADVQGAIKASQQADLKLIDNIQRLKTATPAQIKRIEQTAGIKGLTKAIEDATKAKTALKEVWAKIDKTTFGSKEYIALLPELEKAKTALYASLAKYQALLKTRISRYTLAFEDKIADIEKTIQRAEKGLKEVEKRLDDITMPSAKKEYYEEWYSIKNEIEELNTQLKALEKARETGIAPQDLRWVIETKTAGKAKDNLSDLAQEIDDIFETLDKSLPDTPAKPTQATGTLQPELGLSVPRTTTATVKAPKVDIDIDIKSVAGSAIPEPTLSVPQMVSGQSAAKYLAANAPKIIPEITIPLAGIKVGTTTATEQKPTAKAETTISDKQMESIQSVQKAYQEAGPAVANTAAVQIADTVVKPETGTRQQVVTGIEAAINEGVKAAEEVIQKAGEKIIDETKLQQSVSNAVDAAIQAQAKTLPATKTTTSVKNELANATDVIINTAITIATASMVTAATGKPIIPIRIPLPDDEFKELTKKESEGAVGWKQGFIYILIYPPYGDNQTVYTKEPIPGVPYHDGLESAYKSITKIGGKLPPKILKDMGIMDVKITTVKGKPKISFKRDEKVIRGLSSAR